MPKFKKMFLYLVVLGGRAAKANVELHDVRWVVGSCIEDSYDFLRRDWFESLAGIHIDSYKRINYVDGYMINLKNVNNTKLKSQKLLNKNSMKKYLWFVNIGVYSPSSMLKKH